MAFQESGMIYRASAPGKVLLLGEHAVVHGQPALAAALDKRVHLTLRDLRGSATSGLRIIMEGPDAPAELVHALDEMAQLLHVQPQLEVRIASEIPLGSGLGSSAALGVALARVLSQVAGKVCTPEDATRLAMVIERRFHGAPSGVDPAISAREGMILFRRAMPATESGPATPEELRCVVTARPVHLVVGLTGITRGTRSSVMPLKARREANPNLYNPLLKALGELALGGALAVERGDFADLGVRFDAAHGILIALGVSCPELDTLVHQMKRAGALGAKLTGAGGGGAAIALAESPEHAAHLVSSIQSMGLEAFAVALNSRASGTEPAPKSKVQSPKSKASRWATAEAHANIALVKYWGKRDEALLLPEASSFSLSLDALRTQTTVALGAPRDEMWLDGNPAKPKELVRARALLDAAGIAEPAFIESFNQFPTGAGLASSASGFAALAVAAMAAAGKNSSLRELSALARLGSGSATRSVSGGWSIWKDEAASQVFAPEHWAVRMVVAACRAGEKEVSSRDGMRATQETSPFHRAFIDQCGVDLPKAVEAVRARDLHALGRIAESNALRMHADALSADPPILYWLPATVACLHRIAKLRREGIAAYATIDAGPHVVALCLAADAGKVREALAQIPGVERAFICAPADGARVLETNHGAGLDL
jgi:diphosphomevalonate decarboxylase